MSLLLLLACTAGGPRPSPSPGTDTGATDSAGPTDSAPPVPPPYDCGPDHAALTAGVSTIDQGGSLPSLLIVHGDQACPLVVDESGRTFVAAATWGAGHVLHTGHEGMITNPMDQAGDAAILFRNALAWMGGATPRIGVEAGFGALTEWLEAEGLEVVEVGVDELGSVDVFVATSYTERTTEEYAAIRDWVEAGGGLIQGGHAWYWAYDHEDVAETYMGNQILNPMGITITEATVDAGTDTVSESPPSDLLHAGKALTAVEAHLDGSEPLSTRAQATAADTVGLAVQLLPFSFALYFDRVHTLLAEAEPVVPTVAAPVVPDDQPIEALLVTIQSRFAEELPVDEVTAVPTEFPGPVPAASPRVSHTVSVHASYAGRDPEYSYSGAGEPVWRGTGVYAPPGEIVTVTVPAGWVGQGLSVRIGAHTDELWHLDTWQRHPELSRVFPVDAASNRVVSAFGGPVYLRVPAGVDLGDGEVTLDGGVLYARFVSGGDADVFRGLLPAAPVAEFESDRFILTVPSAEVPAGDPQALTDFWDAILDADAALAAIPVDRVRPERFAVDVQISAGWMHSGYPLMGYQYTEVLADPEILSSAGDWGAFHELGHNHQYGPTNLPGTTECTVNLWSVYDFEEVIGLDRAEAHPALSPASREAAIEAYLAGGRDFEADWNVWTCLETYLQLQEAFGWELYQGLNATYLAMPDAERPGSDAERVDTWVVTSSRQAGFDLTGFYEAWGFPISAGTYTAVADLPPWTDHPMAGR